MFHKFIMVIILLNIHTSIHCCTPKTNTVLYVNYNLTRASQVALAEPCLSTQEKCEMSVWLLGQKYLLEQGMEHTPVFLPAESHRQRIPGRLQTKGHKELAMTEATWHACMHNLTNPGKILSYKNMPKSWKKGIRQTSIFFFPKRRQWQISALLIDLACWFSRESTEKE